MIYFWKEMPFVRFIVPLIVGIVFQFYTQINVLWLVAFLTLAFIGLLVFSTLKISLQYRNRWMTGVCTHIVLLCTGAMLVYNADIKHNKSWAGHYLTDSTPVVVTIAEPLVAKPKSYKAEATIERIYVQGKWQKVKGRLLIYFGKDSTVNNPLQYGSQILFNKPLQEIKNSGNPGNFNYKQFNAFKDIYHQAFLKQHEYVILQTHKFSSFQQWLYDIRAMVIKKLQQLIPGSKEAGVAEALLIGYRDDLDKDLVQAYSNTGVVHIIAISGLHLGMIYAVLVFFFKPFKNRKWIRWLKPVIILSVLWIFTFLAGAVPSILRSAVMFSFIVLGESINRKSSVYNTLASSAFVMLCLNPYFVWDIGFQLSYIAVVSIVAFSTPVYNWFFVQNKILDFIWKLTSVTLAAQILTVPLIFYSFHQFPNLFLLTNCVVVPLSSIVLFAELVVLIVSPWAVLAKYCGMITGWLLYGMNSFIEMMSSYKYAVTDYIQVSLGETILLYLSIIFLAVWLLYKSKMFFYVGFSSLFIFILITGIEWYGARTQKKVIVYNVPKQTAIDFIEGNGYAFVGDSIMTTEGYLKNFHLKPSRTLYKATNTKPFRNLYVTLPFMYFNHHKLLLIDKPYNFETDKKIDLDAIVLSKNTPVSIADLSKTFNCKMYVADGANSAAKINKWKLECKLLQLPIHICTEKGAFEMKL